MDAEVAMWPANAESIGYFIEMGTQWRVGPGGFVGLDYNVFIALADRRGIKGEDFERLLADLQIMEDEALLTMQAARDTP